MRIAIDFNVVRNEIVLVCENADSSCAESCINFIAPGMDALTVHTERGGETVQTVLTVSNGSACHVLDDTLMRTAGTFTIYAEDKQHLRFIVPENIPAGVEYTISLTDEGFRVKYVAPTGGGDHDCLVKSVNGQTGHVVIEIPETGGGDEHECAVKSVNGQTGAVVLTASNVGALPNDGTAANAEKLGGQHPGFYLQKVRNLLDNSDFTNPVNQRGETLYSGGVYGIDRWKGETYYSFVSVADNYLSLYIGNSGTEAAILQRIEPGKIQSGKPYTVAVGTYGGEVFSASGIAKASMSEVTAGNSYNKVQFGYDGHYFVRLVTTNATGFNIKWVALYEGEFAANALPAYIPKEYAVELAECQRYYRRDAIANRIISGHYSGSNKAFIFPIPFEMRELPTVTASGTGVFRTIAGYSTAEGYTTANGGNLDDLTFAAMHYGVRIAFETAATKTNNTPGTLALNEGAYIEYSAEL